MQRNWSRIFALLGISLLVILLTACGAGGSKTVSSTIKIGTDFPTSAQDATAGGPTQNGANLAIKQANDQHLVPGVTFVPVNKDDVGASGAYDQTVGQKNVTALAGDAEVAGIVGPQNSSVAQTELPVTNHAPLALISPANTNDCLTINTDPCAGPNNRLDTYRPTGHINYFRLATPDRFQSLELAQFAYNMLHFKNVYILDDSQTYGVGIADGFQTHWQELGGTIVGRKRVAPTTTSFVNLLTLIAAATPKPDFIFFGGNASTGSLPLRQQMLQVEALHDMVLIGGDGIQTSAFAKAIGHVGGQVYTSRAVVDAKMLGTDISKKFLADYAAAYGQDQIGAYSASSYDCAMILIQAIKKALAGGAKPPTETGDLAAAKTFRTVVINALKQTDYIGVTGHHTFDANGDTSNRVISIYHIAADPSQGNGWDYDSQLVIPRSAP